MKVQLTATAVLAVVGVAVVGYVGWRAYHGLGNLFGGVRQSISDGMDSVGLYMDQDKAIADMYRGTSMEGALGGIEPPRQPTQATDIPDPGGWWNMSDIHGA